MAGWSSDTSAYRQPPPDYLQAACSCLPESLPFQPDAYNRDRLTFVSSTPAFVGQPKDQLTYTRKTLMFLGLALAIAQTSFASTVTWNLNGVTFNDAATATGTFDWDVDTHTLSNWNISVGAGTLSAFTYTPADSAAGSYLQVSGYQEELLFSVNGSTRQLRMTPVNALTNAGGIDPINLNTWGGGSGAVECFNCGPYRPIVAGSFAAAPEPGSLGLLGFGFAGVSLSVRKLRSRRKADQTQG